VQWQRIADWLKQFGMSEYAQYLAENEIDVSVLRHLTDRDLKDIGVPLGHRRKMLAAVGELGGATPASTEPVAGARPQGPRHCPTPPSHGKVVPCSTRFACSRVPPKPTSYLPKYDGAPL
jgi:SAM domain (Sterile alpha motif)